LGEYALGSNTIGNYNTALGYKADISGDYVNGSALGYSAVITANDQVRIGNSAVISIGGYTNWSNISDGRIKKNIKTNVPGLAFINKLQPITYNLNLDAAEKIVQRPAIKTPDGKTIETSQEDLTARKQKEEIVYTGFIAQDVERAAKELNYEFSGVDAAKNDKDLYGIRYAEFVVPLVKAVQELSQQNDELKKEIADLKAFVFRGQANFTEDKNAVALNNASLKQNIPNPFDHTTTINYTLPQTYTVAIIGITDKSGKLVKEVNVSGKGNGSLTLDASILAIGVYNYSLYVEAKKIDTKQMVIAR
jgi:hypothetical protein